MSIKDLTDRDEAFHLEREKVQKATDFLLNMKCSCTGEGVGTHGGCDRCCALDALSTFGWDFYALSTVSRPTNEKVDRG